MLILGLFFIFWAFDPYLNVLRLSCLFYTWGEMQTIMQVFEFPPKDSAKSLVSLDSLNGRWFASGSLNALIRRPSVDKLLLMFLASRNA